MKKRLALCSVVSLAFCGAALAQSGEREAARTPAASARCQALTGVEGDHCLKRKTTKTARKSQPADARSGGGSSVPGGRADGEPGSYGPKAPPRPAD